MSLLLDALKKAAQDKQKNAGNAATPPEPLPPAEPELTLDLEAIPAAAEDAVPVQNSLVAEPSLDIPHDAPAPTPTAEELPTLAGDITPPPAEIRHEAAAVPRPVKPAASPAPPPVLKLEPAPQQTRPATPAKPAATMAGAQPSTLAMQQAAAKQRDALEMMINKSRQADDQRRIHLRTGLFILSLLLLLLSGIYFYAGSEPALPVAPLPPPVAEPAVVVAVEPPAPVQQTAAVTPAPAQVKPATGASPKPRRSVAAVAAPVTETPAAPLQFSKTTRPDPIESLLAQAYEKFHAADYAGANQLYTQVLQREADNRDGLLGAAAVAMKLQRFDYARDKYRQLLLLDPKDSLARAGMSSIDMDVRDESQLKFMLREQPDAAHLHFALGALYASQTRWSEAQQAYFNAFSGDSSNADYAYNLAVSLDRLGQYKAASDYYRKALQLAETRRGNFVGADLESRIDQIARLPDSVR